jgi:sugar (pentulose or hexulose) kinase
MISQLGLNDFEWRCFTTLRLSQIVDTMVGCGAELTRLVASDNGLANPIWRQIVADILNRPLCQASKPLKELE